MVKKIAELQVVSNEDSRTAMGVIIGCPKTHMCLLVPGGTGMTFRSTFLNL